MRSKRNKILIGVLKGIGYCLAFVFVLCVLVLNIAVFKRPDLFTLGQKVIIWLPGYVLIGYWIFQHTIKKELEK